MLPPHFDYLTDPRIHKPMDYVTSHNFIGRPIQGYHAPVCILTQPAIQALIAIQDELDTYKQGHQLKIFDAYRPQQAVDDFIRWSEVPHDQKMKALYYPHIPKSQLFELGYLAKKSSHSRGSTVDLTITKENQELTMGTIFDLFDETSHTLAAHIPEEAKQNRFFLKTLMEKYGFENYPLEWWHFTLVDEPYPDTYFDFPIL